MRPAALHTGLRAWCLRYEGTVPDYGLDETPDRVDLRGIAQGVAVHRLR